MKRQTQWHGRLRPIAVRSQALLLCICLLTGLLFTGQSAHAEEALINVAVNKSVAARLTSNNNNAYVNPDRPLAMAVDGTIPTGSSAAANYADFGSDDNRQSIYFQVDFSQVCDIVQIKMWRYWNDGRTYDATVIALSETPDFSSPVIVYNSDTNNVHGFGAGSDARYAETRNGRTFDLPEAATARYLRVYTYGVQNGGTTNHIVELEAYGYEPPPSGYVFPGTPGFTIIDDRAADVNFMGNAWIDVADNRAHGGTSRQNCTTGGEINETAAVVLTFTGTAVKVYGQTGPEYVDADYILYNETGSNQYRWEYLSEVRSVSSHDEDGGYARELISFSGLANTQHKLRIVTNGLINIDFFEVSTNSSFTNPKAVSLDVPPVTMKQHDYQVLSYTLKAADGSHIARRPTLSSDDANALTTYATSPSTSRLTGNLGVMARECGESSIKVIYEDIVVDVPVMVQEISRQPLRRTVDRDHFLYLENYYWGDDLSGSNVLKLWETVPDSLKPHTVILLIAERSIHDEEFLLGYAGQVRDNPYQKSKDWIEYNVALCNEYDIPVAIQAVNGETGIATIPIEWYDALAKRYSNIQGLNGAEMYNAGFSWGNDFQNYMTQLTRVCVENGLHLMWTDTELNVIGTWIQSYAPMERIFRENKEHIIMMNKQSFSDPSSEALYKGLWLTDYCDNWGVASDWWNWQIKNYNLYYEGISLAALAKCYSMPEVRYAKDILRVISQGATAFKSEAQWFSNGTLDMRMPAYQRVILPLLERVASGEIRIPNKEEVIGRTKAIAVGESNWVSTYNTSISDVGPYDSALGIVPYTLTTTPQAVLDKLQAAGMTIFNSDNRMTAAKARSAYAGINYVLDAQGTVDGLYRDGYLETYGDGTWYWQSTYDNREVTQSSTFAPVKAGADRVSITAGSHTAAVFTETDGRMGVFLNNYRYFKDDLRAMNPPDETPCNEAYYYSHRIARQLRDGTVPEGVRHETVLEVTTSQKPSLVFAPANGYGNPYDAALASETTVEWNTETGTAVITIVHNGPVAFDLVFDGATAPASQISLNRETVMLSRYNNIALDAITNRDAANRYVTWTSDNPAVASVSPYGVVYAAGAGTAVIMATTADGVSASCTVAVPDPMITLTATGGGSALMTQGEEALPACAVIASGTAVELTATADDGFVVGAVIVNGADHTAAYRVAGKLTLTPATDTVLEILFVPQDRQVDDTTALRTVLDAMRAYDEALYDRDSYSAFAAVVKKAEALLDRPASAEELAACIESLYTARDRLTERVYYTPDDPFLLPAAAGERRSFEAEHAVLDVTINNRYAKLIYHDSADGIGYHTITAYGGVFVGDYNNRPIGAGNVLRFAFYAPSPGVYTFLPRFRGSGVYAWSGNGVVAGSASVEGVSDTWTVGAFQVEVTAAGLGEIVFTAPAGGMPTTDRFEVVRESGVQYNVTSSIKTIVKDCAANIPADITFIGDPIPFELGLYNPDGDLIETIQVTTNGRYVFRITSADTVKTGAYVISAIGADGGFSLNCVALPENIWTPDVITAENAISVVFGADVTFNESKKAVRLGGDTVAGSKTSTSGKVVTITDVTAIPEQELVISGVKYTELFPSYSFTFTLMIP